MLEGNRDCNTECNTGVAYKISALTVLGERLRLARKQKGLTQKQAAELIGVSLRTIIGHEKGIHRAPDATIYKYSEIYQCNRAWLLTGKGDPFRNDASRQASPQLEALSQPQTEGSPRDKYLIIPEIEGRAIAGPDGGLLYDHTHDYYPFKTSWIYRKFGRDPQHHKALVLVKVSGESLIPTINPGELILVDTWEAERLQIKDGRIYLVRMPDGTITVKRLMLNKGDGKLNLVCLSDNPNFEPFKFQVEKPLQWYVLGRIRWVGREID